MRKLSAVLIVFGIVSFLFTLCVVITNGFLLSAVPKLIYSSIFVIWGMAGLKRTILFYNIGIGVFLVVFILAVLNIAYLLCEAIFERSNWPFQLLAVASILPVIALLVWLFMQFKKKALSYIDISSGFSNKPSK